MGTEHKGSRLFGESLIYHETGVEIGFEYKHIPVEDYEPPSNAPEVIDKVRKSEPYSIRGDK